MFASRRRRGCDLAGPHRQPQYGAAAKAANLPALSICRLESPEEILKKLQKHAADPAMAEFTCPICWEPFWQPVRTVCGHAFCEGCLLKSVLAQLGYDQPDVSCPMCRHPLHVEDVTADEALLARIRLVVAQKSRESEPHSRPHAGRLHRGSTRSPIAAIVEPISVTTTSPRMLRCTGQPCTPAPVEWPRACSSGAQRTPFQGSWMRAAPDSRPATSGCVAASHKSAFWPPSFSARPSTSGVWAGSTDNQLSEGVEPQVEAETVHARLWPTWPTSRPNTERSDRARARGHGTYGDMVSENFENVPATATPSHKLRPCSQPSKQGRRSDRVLPLGAASEQRTSAAPRSSRGTRAKRQLGYAQMLAD